MTNSMWAWIFIPALALAGCAPATGGYGEVAPQQSESTTQGETQPAEEQAEETESIPATEDDTSSGTESDDTSLSSEYTVGEKLAIIDDRWDDMELYDRRFQQVAERCPNNEESRLGDALVKSTQLLDERAISVDSLEAMEAVLASIPPSDAGTFDCVEVLTLWIILRIEEG